MSMKNSNDTIGDRTGDLPVCSAVPQPTVPLCAPLSVASIKYYQCVSILVLVIHHAMRMHHIVICGLPGSTTYEYFPHYLINSTIFEKKKKKKKKLLNTKCVF